MQHAHPHCSRLSDSKHDRTRESTADMTSNRKFRRSVLAAVGAIVLASTLTPATASADQPPSEPDSTQLVQPMAGALITGIEPQDGGGVLATLDNGVTITMTAEQYQVWLESPAGQQFTNPGHSPQVVVIVPGNCGTSMITITSDGYNQAEILTGFDVIGEAVQYSWNIYMADSYGFSTKGWGGLLNFRSQWRSGPYLFSGGGPSELDVWIQGDSDSWAQLSQGTICFSAPVLAETYVYP